MRTLERQPVQVKDLRGFFSSKPLQEANAWDTFGISLNGKRKIVIMP